MVRKNAYDEKGRLIKTTDALGRVRETVYGIDGLPKQIIQPDGSCILFSHDEKGNIRCMTDPYGCTVRYDYDSLNRVIKTTDGEGNSISYQYDEGNRLVSVSNQEGATRNYVYNATGKPIQVEDFDGGIIHIGYNAIGKPEEFTDKEGNRTRAEYDLSGNLAKTVSPTGLVTSYQYDSDNRLIRVEAVDSRQEDGKVTVMNFSYDPVGNRLHESAGDGKEILHEVSYEYDALNRIIAVMEPVRGRTSYEYDSVTGRICGIIDALGNRKTFRYNAVGELSEKTDIHGNTTHYEYNTLGQVVSVSDGAGRVTRHQYMSGGRREKTIYPDGRQVTYEYDGMGRVSRETDGQGYSLLYDYDVMGRVQRIASNAEQEKFYAYDVMGNITTITDADGNTTRYTYTLNGKLCTVMDALGNRTEYVHDAAGGLISVCQHGKGGETDRFTEYKRDAFGRVICIRDALGGEEFYCYDALGRVTEKMDRDGMRTLCTYTEGGKVGSILYEDGCRAEFGYTPLGQLAIVRDWLGETRLEWDRQGRISSITDHEGRMVCYEWGSMGERRRMTYPDGTMVSFQYDEMLRPTEFVRSAKGRDALWVRYRYDRQGRLVKKENSGGYCTEWDYNGLGQLEYLVHKDSMGVLDRYCYGYDVMGNKISVEKERRGLPEESGSYHYGYDALQRLINVEKDGKMLRSYHYDSFGNRTGMEDYRKGIRNSYVYDAMNRMQEELEWQNQNEDGENETGGVMAGFFSDSSYIHKTYTYDGRGNMTGEYQNGDLLHGYRFNAMNRLAEAWNDEGQRAEYTYNALGQRTGKDGSGGKESYLLDLSKSCQNLIGIESGCGKQDFYWNQDIEVMEESGGKPRYYMLDELGSSLRVLYNNGNGDAYEYDEFGMELLQSKWKSRIQSGRQEKGNPFGYTGYCYDNVSATYFAQAREYEPRMGRFISEDVISKSGTMINALNQYGYCLENPLKYIDLNGKEEEEKEIAYVYYINDFEREAKWQIEQLKESGMEVKIINLNTADGNKDYVEEMERGQMFIETWNGVDENEVIDSVYIFCHGTERLLQFENGSYYNGLTLNGYNSRYETTAGAVGDLEKRNIENLYIQACNTGMINYLKVSQNNVASILSRKISDDGITQAWDGSVAFGPPGKIQDFADWIGWNYSFEARTSYAQSHFNEVLRELKDNNPNVVFFEKPQGLVSYKNGRLIDCE